MSPDGILAVGAIGHRHLADLEKVLGGVERAIRHIRRSFPGSKIRVLSSLAEGADRLLVKRLLRIGSTTLWVPLPLPIQDYMLDFKTSASRQEFSALLGKAEQVIQLPPASRRDQAYLSAGQYILDTCECLVAIWDGLPPQGTAGTGALVSLARQRLLPLAWIHAGNRHFGTGQALSLGSEQGLVTYENFPPPGRVRS